MRALQSGFEQCKNAAMPMPTCSVYTTCKSFKMMYCMTFYLKGHQNYHKSKLKLLKSLFLLSKMESLNLQVVAVLMPLEIDVVQYII